MPSGTDMVCHVGLDAVRVSHLVDSVRTSFATGVVRHPHSCVYVTEPPEALYLCVCMCTYSYSSVHLYIYIHTDRDIHIPCISGSERRAACAGFGSAVAGWGSEEGAVPGIAA